MKHLPHGTSTLYCRLLLGVVLALSTSTIHAQSGYPFSLPGLAIPAHASREYRGQLNTRLCASSDRTLASEDTLIPPSGGNATTVSVMGTVIPVGTGILMLKIRGTKHDTELPVWLIVSGVFVGPSLGYIAEGEAGKGIGGVAIRSGIGVAVASVAFAAAMNNFASGSSSSSSITPLLYLGSMIIVGHAAYDMLNAGTYVKEQREERRRSLDVQVLPTYDPDTRTKGLAVHLGF